MASQHDIPNTKVLVTLLDMLSRPHHSHSPTSNCRTKHLSKLNYELDRRKECVQSLPDELRLWSAKTKGPFRVALKTSRLCSRNDTEVRYKLSKAQSTSEYLNLPCQAQLAPAFVKECTVQILVSLPTLQTTKLECKQVVLGPEGLLKKML